MCGEKYRSGCQYGIFALRAKTMCAADRMPLFGKKRRFFRQPKLPPPGTNGGVKFTADQQPQLLWLLLQPQPQPQPLPQNRNRMMTQMMIQQLFP